MKSYVQVILMCVCVAVRISNPGPMPSDNGENR